MVANPKDKNNKSKNNKKQVQTKESKTQRLIKERKRKAQLRTNPALSIYESGRERTKRVVKKEYPLVNINKLPSILIKGNDNIGVVWKNTNKIQSHTLFSTTNLPSREPASKDDMFYLVAPYKEPKSINFVDEYKKCKLKVAKENQNRYQDIKLKIEKSKLQSNNKNSVVKNEQRTTNGLRVNKTNVTNNKEKNNGFNAVDDTYEESIEKNFIPLISSFSINPLIKNRFIEEIRLNKTLKGNNDESLHKVKKKINKNKPNLVQNKLNKINKVESLIMNKGIFNNFDDIMNSIQPLDFKIPSKPVVTSNNLIGNQNMIIPNNDLMNDHSFEDLILNNNKLNSDVLMNHNLVNNKEESEDDLLLKLLIMNENDPTLMDENMKQKLLNNPLLNNSLSLNEDLNTYPFDKPIARSPKRSKQSGSLDEILAPFKVPVTSPKIKTEEAISKKNNFSSFNYFNFEDMNLPKIELPQELKDTNGLIDLGLNDHIGLDSILANDILMEKTMIKKELPSPPHEKIFEKKISNMGGLGEIAKFTTNVPSNKLPKNEFNLNDGFDMKKVKHEDGLSFNYRNSQNYSSPHFVGNDAPDDSLLNLKDLSINHQIKLLDSLINSNENELMGDINSSILSPALTNELIPNKCEINQNMAIEAYNADLNFSSPYLLPNTFEDVNNLLSSDTICNNPSTLKSIKNNMKQETIQGCCSDNIPLATTTTTNIKTIPDWYNQNGMEIANAEMIINDNNSSYNYSNTNSNTDSPQLLKPLVPNNESFLPELTKGIFDDSIPYDSYMDIEAPQEIEGSQVTQVAEVAQAAQVTQVPLGYEIPNNLKPVGESNLTKKMDVDGDSTKDHNMETLQEKEVEAMNLDTPVKAKAMEGSKEKETEELSEKIVDEIINRLANDNELKEKTDKCCFKGCSLQETSKILIKMAKELKEISSGTEQLELSENKWKEWRKNILSYETEAHQWLNARIEFYSRRVNEYRKDWIEYWIKRYLMQQRHQIKTLNLYINIPQNLQFTTTSCLNSSSNINSSTTITTANNNNNNNNNNDNETNSNESSEDKNKNDGEDTTMNDASEPSEEKATTTTTSKLVAITADISKDSRYDVIGRTVEVASKELLNSPKLIEEYHEKLLKEKELLLEKYDVVDSLNIIPTECIKTLLEDEDHDFESENIKTVSSNTKKSTKNSKNKNSTTGMGFHGRKDRNEVASVLIDEYIKAPYEGKRIFIHGIPKDYQLMFNDKMKSLMFILDKCIQDKKDLFQTMKENRKQYFISSDETETDNDNENETENENENK